MLPCFYVPVTNKINDAYVLSRGQGDPFCGRCLRFASLHSEEFARLPPHFRPLGPGETDKLDITNLFSDIFCETSDYTVDFKRLVPYLYARIVYSWDKIRAKLPHSHILYSHKAIQALLDENRLRDIRARLVGLNDENNFFECKCGCGMTASGVPALTTQFHQVKQMEVNVGAKLDDLYTRMDSFMTSIISGKEEMMKEVSESVFQKIHASVDWKNKESSVQAVIDLMKEQFGSITNILESQSHSAALQSAALQPVSSSVAGVADNTVDVHATVGEPSSSNSIGNSTWYWTSPGQSKAYGPVPVTFDVRGKTFQTVFANQWFQGSVNPEDGKRIMPYTYLRGSDLPLVMNEAGNKLISQKVNWYKAQQGITAFIKYIQEKEKIKYDSGSTSSERYKQILESITQGPASTTDDSVMIRVDMLNYHFGQFISEICGKNVEHHSKLNDKRHLMKVVTIGKWYTDQKKEKKRKEMSTDADSTSPIETIVEATAEAASDQMNKRTRHQ